jgi:mannan endo-1,4-beta-mannosidase
VPGGSHHALYRSYLDRVADFFESCQGDDGELIPLIFRPFHEHTGNWFWWGADHTTDAEYIALWRFTVDYLRHQRGFSHLLFAFSPGGGELRSARDYLFRYPGDAYVDVMGVDHYYDTDVASLVRAVGITVAAADAHHKLAALTEFGIRDGLSELSPPNWFSKNFFEPLVTHPSASRIAYALAWRNAGVDHCFVPYTGHPTAADYRRVCDDPRLVLQRDLPLKKDTTP